MQRIDIIDAIGREYCTPNIEKGEFSYPKAFKEKGLDFKPIQKKHGKGSWQFLDIRFEADGVSVLVETKNNADKWPTVEEQISAYVEYEVELTGNKIIAMVANTDDDRVEVWKSAVEDDRRLEKETSVRSMQEYVAMFDAKHTNNKEEVMRNTYQLNELLHRHGIGEKLRSQFVGTCLLAIKNGLVYDRKMKTAQIIGGIRTILEDLLEGSMKKAEKLTLIDKRVLQNQDVRDMDSENLCKILDFIRDKIYPFINDKSTAGQDLLNLFFITFNKYVGKSDKNQAFTPDHITDFMSKICNVNKNSVVLDMACGSGSFLVRAMTQALADCHTKAEEDEVKKNLGRVEQMDENGNSLWAAIEEKWIDTYKNRDVVPGFSARHMVTGDDEWLCEAYMETDYSTLTEQDFKQTVNDYLAYLVRAGAAFENWQWIESYIGASHRKSAGGVGGEVKSHRLDTTNWKEYLVDDIFDSVYKVSSYDDGAVENCAAWQSGAIPYVTRTDLNNGVKSFVNGASLVNVEAGNAVVIGDTTSTISYQPKPFIAGEHIIAARGTWMNEYTGLFITCLLRQERYRYSYGRAYKLDLIRNTMLRLPPASDGSPDWQWMEEYIRTLPYDD
ncbi:MAG: N-6 DNA methylase [Anaerovoracaceae bacterium]|jgi:hypothetical protein